MRIRYLRIETEREGYSEDQVIDNAITIGELIKILSYENEDLPVLLSFDRGYTFGTITIDNIKLSAYEEEEEDEEDED